MVNFCAEHNFPKSYLCTFENCSQASFSCVLCIRSHHKNCQDKIITCVESLGDRLRFEGLDPNSEDLYRKMDHFLDEKIENLRICLLNRKKLLLTELRRTDALIEGDEFWNFIKRNSEISIGSDLSTISIRSKFKVTESNILEIITDFEKEAESQIGKFLSGFEKIRFAEMPKMKLEDWFGHESILISESAKGISFKAGIDFITNKDMIKYMKIPNKRMKFQVTIDEIRTDARYLIFGIFPVTCFLMF